MSGCSASLIFKQVLLVRSQAKYLHKFAITLTSLQKTQGNECVTGRQFSNCVLGGPRVPWGSHRIPRLLPLASTRAPLPTSGLQTAFHRTVGLNKCFVALKSISWQTASRIQGLKREKVFKYCMVSEALLLTLDLDGWGLYIFLYKLFCKLFVLVGEHMHVSMRPREARKGHWVSWSWASRWLGATWHIDSENWVWVLRRSRKCS